MTTPGTQPSQTGGSANARPLGPIGGSFGEARFSDVLRELWLGAGWQAGRNSRTLSKHPDLRILLTALKAHAYVHEHYAAGSVAVQTIEGHLRMHIPGRTFDLKPGDMIVLEPAVPHDIEALTNSTYLLTIAWHEASVGQTTVNTVAGHSGSGQ